METRAKLLELRAVAERLALGEFGDRVLRGLFCDLVDVMLGGDANHPDVNTSGARLPPPTPEQLGAARRAAAPGVGTAADPAGDTWLADSIAELEKRKAEEAAAAAAPKAQAKEDPKKAASPTPNGGH